MSKMCPNRHTPALFPQVGMGAGLIPVIGSKFPSDQAKQPGWRGFPVQAVGPLFPLVLPCGAEQGLYLKISDEIVPSACRHQNRRHQYITWPATPVGRAEGSRLSPGHRTENLPKPADSSHHVICKKREAACVNSGFEWMDRRAECASERFITARGVTLL